MKRIIALFIITTAIFYSAIAQNCDTLFNLRSNLDTATFEWADTSGNIGYGYLSGNNTYGDLAKAEGFPAVVGDYLNSATLYFAVVSINPTDSDNTAAIAIWDNTGISDDYTPGAPGNILDTIDVTLGQIAQAVAATNNSGYLQGVLVNFGNGVALPTDTFYVGVILPQAYGDTVVLYTNGAPPGPDGNGWELESSSYTGSENLWGSYNNDWFITGGSLGNYIIADVCSTPNTTSTVSFSATGAGTCPPDTVNFTDNTTPNPGNWLWSFGDGTGSTVQNPSHIYSEGGMYFVTETISDSVPPTAQVYISATDSLIAAVQVSLSALDTVNVYNPPYLRVVAVTDASSPTADNGSAQVNVYSGTPTFSFMWSNDSSTSDTIANVNPGTYNVTVTDAHGCTASTSATIYVTGINTLGDEVSVKIYPNPASNRLNFQWSLNAEADVAIYDVSGQVVKSYTVNGAVLNSFDIHDLESGSYIIRVTDRENNQQRSMLFSKL